MNPINSNYYGVIPINSDHYRVIDENKGLGEYKLNGELFHVANLIFPNNDLQKNGSKLTDFFKNHRKYTDLKKRGWCFEIDGIFTSSIHCKNGIHRLISFVPIQTNTIGIVLVAHGNLSICCERNIFNDFIKDITSETDTKVEYKNDILKRILSNNVCSDISDKIISHIEDPPDNYKTPSPLNVKEIILKSNN